MRARIGAAVWLLAAFVACCSSVNWAGEEPAEADEYEPPPEGYEERYYPVTSLLATAQDFYHGGERINDPFAPPQSLTAENVIEAIKHAVAPESWTRRGPARIQAIGGQLVILHKQEAHAEIGKVLAWLAQGIAAPCRITIVAAALKPETLKKFAAAGTVSPADLFRALDDAGEGASVETVELRGVEGQRVAVNGTDRQSYVADYDVSGAVFDPVMRTVSSGLLANARGFRSPDGKSARVDLEVSTDGAMTMDKAQIAIDGGLGPAPEGEKKDIAAAKIKGALKLDLPSQATGTLATTLTVPRGMFAFAGSLDLSRTGGGKAAVFVRASIGDEGVPTLTGVGGLKEKESFRLYPTLALSCALTDKFSYSHLIIPQLSGPIDVGTSQGAGTGGAMASPFMSTPMVALPVFKAKQMFAEKVRRNKLVEPMGTVLFTRLTEEDHAKMLKTLADDFQRRVSPVLLRAVAVAVPAAAYRKLALGETDVFDAAAVETLATGAGAQLLTDSWLALAREQRAHVYAGQQRSILSDYEISGDSYDPVVRTMLDRGYIFDARARSSVDEKKVELEFRFHQIPAASGGERTVVESFAVNCGASATILLSLRADLDRPKAGVVAVKGNASVPLGKLVLAGAAQMPPGADGKPDGRQMLLFVGAEAGGR